MYPQQNYSPNNQKDYDFIVNPQKPQKRPLLNGSSVAVKAGLVLALVFLLLIGFVVVRGLLSGGTSNKSAIITVVADQKELLRITTSVGRTNNPISDATRNSLATTELSLTSSQTELIKYAGQTGIKIELKDIVSLGSAATDEQLKAALASGTYDATLQDVLRTQLNEYKTDLKTAYNLTTGPNGRELLSNQFEAADMLLKQLPAAQ